MQEKHLKAITVILSSIMWLSVEVFLLRFFLLHFVNSILKVLFKLHFDCIFISVRIISGGFFGQYVRFFEKWCELHFLTDKIFSQCRNLTVEGLKTNTVF